MSKLLPIQNGNVLQTLQNRKKPEKEWECKSKVEKKIIPSMVPLVLMAMKLAFSFLSDPLLSTLNVIMHFIPKPYKIIPITPPFADKENDAQES